MKQSINKLKTHSLAHGKKLLKNKPKTKKAIVRAIRITEKITRMPILNRSRDYGVWIRKRAPTSEQLDVQRHESNMMPYTPLISIVTPAYNTPPKLLKACIESVIEQTYENWELIIVDDFSKNTKTRNTIRQYEQKDPRIKALYNSRNMHIADTTNRGIAASKGEYIGLLDHDDVLYPQALFSIVEILNKKKYEFIYSDEDKISENGKTRSNPFFKPDWSPDFLRSINYITHFAVLKKELIIKIGGPRAEYNGAQDWDLFLRATRQAKSIHHIQDILYGWRMTSNSTAQETEAKPYVVEAQRKALADDLKARGLKADVVQSRYVKDYWEVNYLVEGSPKVSIVIPSKNQHKIIKRCIDSILKKSTYKNYEILVVDTGSDDKEVINYYENLKKYKNIKIINYVEPKFSFANTSNYGAKEAKGKYLIMLNNDTEVITPNWIELMLGDAQRPEVGTVGARLYFPGNKTLQHAGVAIGLGGYAANILGGSEVERINSVQKLYADNKRNVSANTGACMMIRANLFAELKGFDNDFSVTYNDVDLGLRILEKGYLNVYNPAVELTHHESISLGNPEESKRDSTEFESAKKLLASRWSKFIKNDPYYNNNYSKDHADFTLGAYEK